MNNKLIKNCKKLTREMQIGIALPFFLRYNETQVEAEWQ